MTDSTLMNRPYTVVLGGIGPDGHAVGLTVLRHALLAAGYHTLVLGTHNTMADFFGATAAADAVLVSSLDGHARQYVYDFPRLRRRQAAHRPLWYIGGNLSIGKADGHAAAAFLALGFDRVFAKFTDLDEVLRVLAQDLSTGEPVAGVPKPSRPRRAAAAAPPPLPPNGPAADPLMLRARAAVLEQWPTGADARDLAANAAFLAAQPGYPAAQDRVRAGLRGPLLQPRAGVALAGDQQRLLEVLRDSGADVLSYQVDSLTRNIDYPAAARAIRATRAGGTSELNGFPIVNHGVSVLRETAVRLQVPLQARHSARDPRLLAEICYAGGVTSFEGGAISYNVPYHPDLPLAESLAQWAYVDWLTGLYQRRYQVVIDREFFGVLTGTLIPPCLAVVVNLIEMAQAVRYGVRSVSLGYAEQGNRAQDIAAMRVLRAAAARLLHRLGHPGIAVSSVFHQYMAAFPADRSRAAALIRASASTAALAAATRVLTKTPAEAAGVPTVHDNIVGMADAQRGIKEAADLTVDEARVAEEEKVIGAEVSCLLRAVFRAGAGDLAGGVVRCFGDGTLDVPFAPSIHNWGEVLTARDTDGAVRFLRFGNLPLTASLRRFHEARMTARRRAEGLGSDADYALVERDVLRVPRSGYDRWPLSS